MKLVVFPETRRAQVDAVVRETLGPHRGGTEELTLTVIHVTMEKRWSVQVTGLSDPMLERGWCEVIEHALKDAGI